MIELTGHGYTAWILPERGGNCIRLARNGVEALRTPASVEEMVNTNPFLYGTPLLFLPNRISNARFSFENREYVFPVNEPATGCFLHGTMHETPFEVVEQKQDQVFLRYTATDESPYLSFPHAFTLHLIVKLQADGLHQKVEFINNSTENMPVALAFHTAFRLPFCQGGKPDNIRMQLDTEEEYSRNKNTYLPDGGVETEYAGKQEMMDGDFFPACQSISRFFKMGSCHELVLTDPEKGIKIRYQAGDTFGYWMVYNGGENSFLCVEPQSWLSNCPNAPFDREKTGFAFICPGASHIYETLLTIED